MNATSAPTLQPPGAGLPWWEYLAARYFIFPNACRKLDWNAAARLFQKEGTRVLALWDSAPKEQIAQRVLIPRLRGMEDSSRFWSIAMTVEHLNIVGFGIRELIGGLRHGKAPTRMARTEDVKPRGESAPGEVRDEFAQLLTLAAADAAAMPPIPRGEGLRAAHPWFGPLDAFQWHCLLGIHQRIHRRQIEVILASL